MKIPKIIHTCWFGSAVKKPDILEFENVRKAILSDYVHMEWNDRNTDLTNFPFLERAYQSGRFAFVADMVRLLMLRKYGGIYLDADVEVCKKFDDLLHNDLFLGYMWDNALGTAVIGAKPNNSIICALLDIYVEQPEGISLSVPNNDLFTRFFIDNVVGFQLNGKSVDAGGYLILDKEFFEHPSLFRRKNYSVHHFKASWKEVSRKKEVAKRFLISIIGLYLYRKYICAKSFRLSPFRGEYIQAKHGRKENIRSN